MVSAVVTRWPASFGALLASFIAGVALQLQQPLLWPAAGYAALAACVMVLAGALHGVKTQARVQGRAGLVAGLAVSMAAAGLGFGLTGWRSVQFQATAMNPLLEGRDIEVTGRVLAMPQVAEDAVRFRLRLDSARLDGQAVVLPPQILLGWYSGFAPREAKNAPADSSDPFEQLLEMQRRPQPMRAGERWQMTVRLKAPHGNSNPHGFDYELWLWEQGIQAAGYVRAGPRDALPVRLSVSWQHPVERARQAVREAIYAQVSNRPLAGVLAALVVGDQNAIERADWEVFRATGVAHLMSISGLHITMFAWAASLLIGGLWRRSARITPRLCLALPASSAGALGGLLLAALYAAFSGWGVPAQRTIWMLAAVVLLRQSGRQWPWLQTWLLAMAVVVVLDPWALMQAGFWLSFAAVGILFATDSGAANKDRESAQGQYDSRFMPRWLGGLKNGLLKSAKEQWVVTLALTPLTLLLFNQVSLVGLLANAVAIPWVTLVVTPLAMLGVLYAPVWDVAAAAVGLLSALLQPLAGWSLASLSVAAAPLWCALAGVLGGALVAMRLPWHWRLLGIPLLLPVLLWQPAPVAPGQFEILGADIGQGNALLVRTAGHALLYDTGPRFSRESDAGHRVLVPLLRALGTRLDILMLSHRDSDHTGGAPAVLAMQPQARLVSSVEDGHALQALRPSERCAAGQRWVWDGVNFEVLHPQADDYDRPNKSNAMSCVLRISNGRQTALLVGDIEAPQEARLVASQPALLKADFLLVPHHGSKTSSSEIFLDAVQPHLALAQAGYRNRFGHPAGPVAARYDARGIRLIRSAQCGAALWKSAEPLDVGCQRTAQMRYWQAAQAL
ncbi:MAG: DNA internalization-related competence protein ComEC/Rec2 [Polaromonas sp.]|nr:DNA internalization-related competence protein ComEC/Rec2 [Polaromonas sp.]